ncbi:MAG: response regulator [Pseudomonadota bacterium]
MEKRVLVIDDEPSVRNSFVLALEDTYYSVETAASGEEGLEKFRERDFHLIYLDLKMPGMNGVETLREIRKINKDVPVYIVTAFAKEFFEGLNKLTQENIDFELMQKPIGLEAICELTTAVLG